MCFEARFVARAIARRLPATMSGAQLSGTRTKYEEHERQVEELQARIAKHTKPRPVIDFRVCHLS